MSDPIIQLENLTKTFGQDTVLKGVTRDFERGKIHGIVGNNGSGKTVMFNSHVLSDVEELCSHIAIMHRGVIVWTGTVPAALSGGGTLEEFFMRVVST